jgi:hypothetical protein
MRETPMGGLANLWHTVASGVCVSRQNAPSHGASFMPNCRINRQLVYSRSASDMRREPDSQKLTRHAGEAAALLLQQT